MPEANQRNAKHVTIYFKPGCDGIMKALAANVRSQGGKTTLVWSNKWRGAENLIMESRAIIIQKGCAKDTEIAKTYLEFTQDVEVHFVDDNGEFCDAPEGLKATQEEDHAETGESESSDGASEADQSGEVDGPADVPEADDGGEAETDSHGDGEDAGEGPDGDDVPEAEPDASEGAASDKLEG